MSKDQYNKKLIKEHNKKECYGCEEIKPLDEFPIHKEGIGGKAARCNECRRKSKYKEKYGITYDEFLLKLGAQDSKCEICTSEIEIGTTCNVDHNHETGEVRDLLCEKCNRAIGLFQENIDTIENAAAYLKKWGGEKYVSYDEKGTAKHYQTSSIETIVKFERIWGTLATVNYCEMTALKYRERLGNKMGQTVKQDLVKIGWYEAKVIELNAKIGTSKEIIIK